MVVRAPRMLRRVCIWGGRRFVRFVRCSPRTGAVRYEENGLLLSKIRPDRTRVGRAGRNGIVLKRQAVRRRRRVDNGNISTYARSTTLSATVSLPPSPPPRNFLNGSAAKTRLLPTQYILNG